MQRIFAIVVLVCASILFGLERVPASEINFDKERTDFLEAVKKDKRVDVIDKLEHLDLTFAKVTERFTGGGKEKQCYNKSVCEALEEVAKLIAFWDDVLDETMKLNLDKKTGTSIAKKLREKHIKFKQYRQVWQDFLE